MNTTSKMPVKYHIEGGTTPMPCRPVLVFEWCCHGCQQKVWHAERGLPVGWSDQHVARLGPYAKQLDLCPICALDPGKVIEGWQSRFSSISPLPTVNEAVAVG